MSTDPLVIDGMRAVELARLTQGLPGWPGLHRQSHLARARLAPWVPVPLAAAESDLAAGWGVDSYAYPVPRERVAAEAEDHRSAASERVGATEAARAGQLEWSEWCRAALRGSDEAIHMVACALARRDRDELAHN